VFTVRVSPEPGRPAHPQYPPYPGDEPDVGLRLVTGEAVEMDIRVARLGSRLPARLIDLVVQIVIGFVLDLLLILVVGLVVGLDAAVTATTMVVTAVITLIGYPVTIETLTRGRSVGKLAMGIRVVRDDGGPIRFRQALARALVGVAAEFPGVLPALTWYACVGTMLTNPQGKRLGDIAAGTIVIHERTPASWGWVPSAPPELAAWAASLDLTGVTDGMALSVRNYLARNSQLREPARTRLGTELAAELAAHVQPPAPPGTAGWAYLATVIAERHRRSVSRIGAARAAAASVWPELARLTTSTSPWVPLPPGPPAWVPPQPEAPRTPPGLVRSPVPSDHA
jgi:uncharacterized RDD family membrane protein YckC